MGWTMIGGTGNASRILVEKPCGKRLVEDGERDGMVRLR
jgi:hypothetical protein